MTAEETFESFLKRLPGIDSLDRHELARYFVHFLTQSDADAFATPAQVATCFRQAELTPYDDVRKYLSRASLKKRGQKVTVVRHKDGYRLERAERDRIRASLLHEPHKRETETALRVLIGRLSASGEQSFLDEAVKCYEVGAYRAATVLTWLLTVDHLYEFILKHHLASFNIELAKVKDKRVKVNVVSSKDDFADIPEGKFIEIARAANIFGNDVRKILDQKLGTRNSYAHPSTLAMSPVKASEFIQDLISNVVLKYSL